MLTPPWFTDLFNLLVTTGNFPTIWKLARIVLILKANRDLTHPQDYRPICILPRWGKVFDKVIAKRLAYYLEERHLLFDTQFGFRKQRSTIDALQRIKDFILNAQHSNCLTCIISLDIANAFNFTSCPLLKNKISTLNIPSYLKKILFSFLDDRKVVLGDITHKYNIGIPQGSCLDLYCGTSLLTTFWGLTSAPLHISKLSPTML
ncbi:reverse transcriptase domain-containing protein [Caerostris darwini]|uniref:Reverse transcriptase domain-containing protein n=1 Tax=Caerostris darwini TaxID=1538125 RepID=A0AAV4NS94_9ARAC|nr:reverse transcriptase domain-containing protein [Caerostris darwini]